MRKPLLIGVAALGWAVSGITGVAFAETPDKFVRYVEATGSQYVDTGVRGRWNTKIEAQVEWMNFADSAFFSAGNYSDNTRLYMCYTYKHGSESSLNVIYTCAAGALDEVFYNEMAVRWEKNRIYDYVAELSATNAAGETTNKIKIDGLQVWNKSSAGLDTGYNFFIFANNRLGSANAWSKTRCYRLKIWQGPAEGGDRTLVRDLFPCMKNGRAGLYDAVSGDILYSGTGTDLVCDEDSETPDEFVEYVESTGVNFIDTEVTARSGTEAECDFVILNNRVRDKGFLEAYSSSVANPRYYLLHSYQGTVTCGYGTHKTTGANYYVGNRYQAISSLAAGAQSLKLVTNGTTNEIYAASDSTVIDTGLPLYLFGCNKDGNIDYGGLYRVYSLKLKQDGVLVRDFKPCLKNGAFALYDAISNRIFYPKRGLLNGPLRQTAVKARNIIFVDYIESDGTQTLDTGVRARAGTRAKGEFAWAEALRLYKNEVNTYLETPIYRQERVYLGADNFTEHPTFFFMVDCYDKNLIGYYGSDSSSYYAYATDGEGNKIPMTTAGTKYAFDASFMDGAQTIELDGTQVWSLSNSANFDSGRNLHIFSSGSRYRSAARCYGLEIWQDGDKVRDFKPCIYQGKAMLYDTVTESIFRPSPDIPASKTGGVILTGDEKPACYVDYVESDGTIFVDTGVKGKSGTKADVKLMFKESADKGFLDSRNGGTRFYMIHNGSRDNVFYIGYGKAQSFSPCAINTIYDVQSELSVGRQEVTVNGVQKWTTGQSTTNINPSDNIDTGYNLYLFAMDQDGSPTYAGKARLYSLKLYQGNADGSNMQLVRDFKPVRLKNGLVVLWDFVNSRAYLPQSTTSPYGYVQFPAAGPDGERIYTGSRIILR